MLTRGTRGSVGLKNLRPPEPPFWLTNHNQGLENLHIPRIPYQNCTSGYRGGYMPCYWKVLSTGDLRPFMPLAFTY